MILIKCSGVTQINSTYDLHYSLMLWLQIVLQKIINTNMKNLQKESISELHFQHQLWMNELEFYKQELKMLQERLEEIASKNTSKEVHISIEQFQNKFLIQNNEIDMLKHALRRNEEQALSEAKLYWKRADYETSAEYKIIEEKMRQFEKLYKELKQDFFRFLSKWM